MTQSSRSIHEFRPPYWVDQGPSWLLLALRGRSKQQRRRRGGVDWAGEARHVRDIAPVGEAEFAATLDTCRSLIRDRFGADDDRGAAAILLDDRAIVTGTAPEALNSSVQTCHEIEPYCAAFRLGRSVLVSVCLYRESGGRTLVLSPRGVCRERLAADGPSVLVAVADLSEEVREAWMCSETLE